jgi:hypothetical protein
MVNAVMPHLEHVSPFEVQKLFQPKSVQRAKSSTSLTCSHRSANDLSGNRGAEVGIQTDLRLPVAILVKDKRVILSHPVRPSLCRFSFVFIGLAISVFTWGLQYKISLYYPKLSTYHQLPEAKLLSRNEQATATESLLVISERDWNGVCGGLFTQALFVWVFGLFPISGATRTVPERTRPWLVLLSARLEAFFFRPPPTLVVVSQS